MRARGGAICATCGSDRLPVAAAIGSCGPCLRAGNVPDATLARIHERSRRPFGLPASPPRAGEARCRICANRCAPAEGAPGFCGVRAARAGRVVPRAGRAAYVHWYSDPLPTNCVADWVCAGGTGAGYPAYARAPGPERGSSNLAVFYFGCSFDCLFCQNASWREIGGTPAAAEELAGAVDARTSCICHFGGDPGPQIEHALRASRIARERARGRILRICWETNGAMAPRLLRSMIDLSLASGGCIKFDLKAWSAGIHRALCGAGNERTLENFRTLAAAARARPDPPLAIASTLLVPGYIDLEEVRAIARFIASLDASIPYRLLAFHPTFLLADLPRTSRAHAQACARAAREEGLARVSIGNLHILSGADDPFGA